MLSDLLKKLLLRQTNSLSNNIVHVRGKRRSVCRRLTSVRGWIGTQRRSPAMHHARLTHSTTVTLWPIYSVLQHEINKSPLTFQWSMFMCARGCGCNQKVLPVSIHTNCVCVCVCFTIQHLNERCMNCPGLTGKSSSTNQLTQFCWRKHSSQRQVA